MRTPRATTVLSCLLGLSGSAVLGGCQNPGAPAAAPDQSTSDSDLLSINGLSLINGLSMTNGLSMLNGLVSGVGLMTSSSGRQTLSYLVRCALPLGHSVVKTDDQGVPYTFLGQIGVAPEWESGQCGQDCQENVSACMLAHVNTSGQHIALWLDSNNPAIGYGRNNLFPYQEGSFFGNIFASPPQAYFCN